MSESKKKQPQGITIARCSSYDNTASIGQFSKLCQRHPHTSQVQPRLAREQLTAVRVVPKWSCRCALRYIVRSWRLASAFCSSGPRRSSVRCSDTWPVPRALDAVVLARRRLTPRDQDEATAAPPRRCRPPVIAASSRASPPFWPVSW